jgi:glucose-fructose oxidoreductase
MIAFRLHHEPGTLEVIDRVRKGDFGDPRIFLSVFTHDVKAENHRAKHGNTFSSIILSFTILIEYSGFDAGPIPDMGTYPINAVRNIFGLEPIEVTAIGFKTPGHEFLKMEHDTISVTLRFPGDRVAQFTAGYASTFAQGYKVVGTKGRLPFKLRKISFYSLLQVQSKLILLMDLVMV